MLSFEQYNEQKEWVKTLKIPYRRRELYLRFLSDPKGGYYSVISYEDEYLDQRAFQGRYDDRIFKDEKELLKFYNNMKKKVITKDIAEAQEPGVSNSNYKPKVFVDMDGVLANFFDEWEKIQGVSNWRDVKDPNEALKALAGTDFFATLPKFSGKTDELVTFVNGITNGNWYILSAPLRWDREGSIKHKQEWLSKNLPIQPKDAIFDGRKESYAIDKMTGQPNILIDDHSKYIKRWVAKGGIGIQYKASTDSVEKVKRFLEDHLGTMRKDVEIKEAAVGIITKQNTTKDVKPGEIQRQAKKLGFKLDKKGRPPLLHKTAAKNSNPNTLFNIGLVN
jgi:5'(3')-deoxyribonucleotidase